MLQAALAGDPDLPGWFKKVSGFRLRRNYPIRCLGSAGGIWAILTPLRTRPAGPLRKAPDCRLSKYAEISSGYTGFLLYLVTEGAKLWLEKQYTPRATLGRGSRGARSRRG